jgi:hypothetical protein
VDGVCGVPLRNVSERQTHFLPIISSLIIVPWFLWRLQEKNRTPDKLPAEEAQALGALCASHLQAVVQALEPEWVIGVGRFCGAKSGRGVW